MKAAYQTLGCKLNFAETSSLRDLLESEGVQTAAKGEKADIDEVLANLKERDYIDSHREVSPLTQAPDAVVLDNSSMTMDDQMEWVLDLIEKRFAKK